MAFELPCTTWATITLPHSCLKIEEKKNSTLETLTCTSTNVFSNGGYNTYIDLLLFRVRSVHWAMFLPRQSCRGLLSLVSLRGSCINIQNGQTTRCAFWVHFGLWLCSPHVSVGRLSAVKLMRRTKPPSIITFYFFFINHFTRLDVTIQKKKSVALDRASVD